MTADPASPTDIPRLRAIAEAATPGEWQADCYWKDIVTDAERNVIAEAYGRRAVSIPNATYIIAAQPRVVLAMLDELAAARRVVEAAMAYSDLAEKSDLNADGMQVVDMSLQAACHRADLAFRAVCASHAAAKEIKE